MEVIKEYGEIILTCFSLLISIVITVISLVGRYKALKRAKTTEERANVINEIKADVFGLYNTAERLFSDIPKSGASKLLYVLNHVKEICGLKGIDYNEDDWKEFIEDINTQSNAIENNKAFESEKASVIELVKSEVPYFIEDANKLFEVIPDSKPYKIEYILKLVEVSCGKHNINVFSEYDWRAYVGNMLLESEVA